MAFYASKWVRISLIIIAIVLFARLASSAQDGKSMEEKILSKLEIIMATQSKIQESLTQVLNNQAEIKEELYIVKIRASR